MIRISSLLLFYLTVLSVGAQNRTDFFISIGMNRITPKDGFLYLPDIAKRNMEVYKKNPYSLIGLSMEMGLSRNTKHFRVDMGYKLNTVNYKFAPAITPDTETAITKVSYLANHIFFLPNFLIPTTNFSVGLGTEIQYLSKPKIKTQGNELHNIIDNHTFSMGGLFQVSYSFELGNSQLIAGYQYAFYMRQKNPFHITLMYNNDYGENLFTHQPDFNTHVLKIAYVIAK